MIRSHTPLKSIFDRSPSKDTSSTPSRDNTIKAPGGKGFVKMPKTASGNPRFPSRSDGAEAGVVSGGYHP